MRKRKVYFILLILAAVTVANIHFAGKDMNTSGLTLKGLILTAYADFECDPPPYECPDGYVCDMGICKLLKSRQVQECSVVDWCWCMYWLPPNEPNWDLIQMSCQGTKIACNPDPFGSLTCEYGTECSGCEPCDGDPSYPYTECQSTHP